ncbi:BON domain-containing protein [Paraburkholderia caballeronis]|uniref:BON domain-containing protein n=1 Tax=Paraburkholderia caballeronis TaxID=416943 RepID=A0A1H7L6J0_9BURK|nr:BON domain-containing protein [Paraburkholderia caballeronis]PXW28318.1 BON domain-containing protein [Paraburkholderia caballeronis]PXX03684.1 BON domain-containing protein [Paraburkholderia caballeronis]RAK04428.1 BON domain-containing protein [Paraburkholderia caballeronis]SED80596.1 BON domain-containing protein [Paraburkholderia caballeronis]SEK94673.1 BON domain-containing protein [Paraburkholderia caballeronis]
MQNSKLITAVLAAALLAAASAYAQESSDATQSPPPLQKKVLRAQNRQTEHAVRKALTATKGLNSSGVVVLAKNGAVTLEGSVPEESQIALAQNAAQGVAQAKSVTNRLTVKEPGN